jgi:5'-nucleotidase
MPTGTIAHMAQKKEIQILLTNDDGINSPGLWAAAEALSVLGYVTVAAPREQSSGMGRSMPSNSDGIISDQKLVVHDVEWTIYAVGGTPAQAVQHAILEIMPSEPDIVVAGINYGNNIGTGITISGTVGAAMEGASHDIPSLAVSLETDHKYHLTHSEDIDFDAAAHFTVKFAKQLLDKKYPEDAEVLKLEIPSNATTETDWVFTRLTKERFYLPTAPERISWDKPGSTGYKLQSNFDVFEDDSDAHAILVKRLVAVTPINLDMTANIDFADLDKKIRGK